MQINVPKCGNEAIQVSVNKPTSCVPIHVPYFETVPRVSVICIANYSTIPQGSYPEMLTYFPFNPTPCLHIYISSPLFLYYVLDGYRKTEHEACMEPRLNMNIKVLNTH